MSKLRVLLLASAVGVVTSSAFAADINTKAPPAYSTALPAWTGFYLGAQVGYGWDWSGQDLNSTPGQVSAILGNSPQGFAGGGRFGYDAQIGQLVLGIVTDINGSDFKSHGNLTVNEVGTANSNSSIGWWGTLNGRLGLSTPDNKFMPYVTAGLAYGGTKASLNGAETGCHNINCTAAGLISDTSFGWDGGFGIEGRFDKNWSGFIEVRYIELGSKSFPVYIPSQNSPVATSSQQFNFATVMGGINFKF